MDKGIGVLYQRLSNIFHPNASTSPPTNTSSSQTEIGTSLPIATFFDRLIPSATPQAKILNKNNQYHNSSRVSRQISIKTDENCMSSQTKPIYSPKATPTMESKPQM